MSTISYKNQLQEIMQKEGKPLPVYSYINCGGPAHQPIWQATVIVNDKKYTGESNSSKVATATSAAQKALEKLSKEVKVKNTEKTEELSLLSENLLSCLLNTDINRIILVDGENIPEIVNVKKV